MMDACIAILNGLLREVLNSWCAFYWRATVMVNLGDRFHQSLDGHCQPWGWDRNHDTALRSLQSSDCFSPRHLNGEDWECEEPVELPETA